MLNYITEINNSVNFLQFTLGITENTVSRKVNKDLMSKKLYCKINLERN